MNRQLQIYGMDIQSNLQYKGEKVYFTFILQCKTKKNTKETMYYSLIRRKIERQIDKMTESHSYIQDKQIDRFFDN